MTSLPEMVPDGFENHPSILSSYRICLTLERELKELEANNKGEDIQKRLVYTRIVGYLIHFLPRLGGVLSVYVEIVSCKEASDILDLGKMYFNHFIRLFRANKGRTPVPSNHASRPSFDTIVDMISETLEAAPKSHANAKHNALIRDGYRCVVTGRYDRSSIRKDLALRRLALASKKPLAATQCAHIFSESTNLNIPPESDKRVYAATVWAIIKRFGYDSIVDELNGAKIHRLENVMTLDPSIHSMFDQLEIWFTATKEVNKYKLEAINPDLHLRDCLPYVTFTTSDPERLPVPSPDYLAIHAACAKVNYFSGASEFIDDFIQEMEDSQTLAPDGSSAPLLDDAIQIYKTTH